MRLPRSSALLLSLALLTSGVFARQSPPDPNATAFYQAFYLESGLRDFEQAEKAYAEVATRSTAPGAKNYLVSALVGRGRCLIALGRRDEAIRVLESALAVDPDHAEAKRLLDPPADAGIDPELKARITALVQKLATSEREQASADLGKIGALALPFLADGLRSRDVAIVENCAVLLARLKSAAAYRVLADAFVDADVIFPLSMTLCFQDLSAIPESLAILESAMEASDSTIRKGAVSLLRSFCSDRSTLDRGRATALFRRALHDPDPQVASSLASFAYLDDAIAAELAEDLCAWFPTLDAHRTQDAVKSIREMATIAPAFERFAASQLDHSNFEIREVAVEWLIRRVEQGVIESATAFDSLIARVNDRSERIAGKAVETLGESPTLWADDARSSRVRATVLEAARDATGAANFNVYRTLIHALGVQARLDEPFLQEVLDAIVAAWSMRTFQDSAQYMKEFSNAVARVHTDRSNQVEFLAECFRRHDDEAVQRAILSRMRSASQQSWNDPIAQIVLESPHRSVRAEFYGYLDTTVGSIQFESDLSAKALEHLGDDLNSEIGSVSGPASRIAARVLSPLLAGAFKKQWENSSAPNSSQALLTYLKCAGQDALPTLESVIPAPRSLDDWTTAAYGLLKYRGESAVSAILDSIESDPARVDALGRALEWDPTGAPESRAKLIERIADALPSERYTSEFVERAARHLDRPAPTLVDRALTAPDPATRLRGCDLAKSWRLESAEPKLLELLETDTPNVSKAAQEALDEIRRRRELRSATRLSLGFDKSQAIADARELLKNDDPTKRRGGALALGALGDVSAVPLLLKLLDDRDAQVREAALTALGKLESTPPAAKTAAEPNKSDG